MPMQVATKQVQPPVKPLQRVVTPLQRVTGMRNSRPVNNETYHVSTTKRRKKLAEKILKVINHKLSCYRKPTLKKSTKKNPTQQYTLRKRKPIIYNDSIRKHVPTRQEEGSTQQFAKENRTKVL